MDRPIRLNYEEADDVTVELRTFSTYFESYDSYLLTSAVSCTIDANANITESFESDQAIIDSVGDVIEFERERLESVFDSFTILDDTLVSLYQQR